MLRKKKTLSGELPPPDRIKRREGAR